jgi:hypothetical protein
VVGADEKDWADLKSDHDRFIAHYRSAAWDEALETLRQLRARQVTGLTGLYEIYAKRVEKLSENAPEAWDGVYEAEEK